MTVIQLIDELNDLVRKGKANYTIVVNSHEDYPNTPYLEELKHEYPISYWEGLEIRSISKNISYIQIS